MFVAPCSAMPRAFRLPNGKTTTRGFVSRFYFKLHNTLVRMFVANLMSPIMEHGIEADPQPQFPEKIKIVLYHLIQFYCKECAEQHLSTPRSADAFLNGLISDLWAYMARAHRDHPDRFQIEDVDFENADEIHFVPTISLIFGLGDAITELNAYIGDEILHWFTQ